MKILVLICSCNSDKSLKLRQACRETWLECHEQDINYRFFVGGSSDEHDVIALDVDDSYNYLPGKVRECYQNVLRNYEFDYVFKCDDDTYVQLDRLKDLIGSADFGGNEFLIGQKFASGGAGYFMSREVLQKILSEEIPDKGLEDVTISALALKHATKILSTPLLRFSGELFPSSTNNLVSSHWLNPSKMRFIRDTFSDQPFFKLETFHNSWTDTLVFYSGVFKREGNGDFGKWEKHGDELHLIWDQWPVEIVNETPTGFVGETMRMNSIDK